MCTPAATYMFPHSTHCMCVLILLYMCLHTRMCPRATTNVSSYYCARVRLLLYVCPYTTIYAFSSYCIRVLVLLCVIILLCMCPHPTMYVSAYCYMCHHTTKRVLILALDKAADQIFKCSKSVVSRCGGFLALLLLILLHMCPHTNIFVPHATTNVFVYSYLSWCCGRLLSMPAYTSIRQHTSAYVIIRPHTYVIFSYTDTCRVVAAILPCSQCRWQRR